MILLIPADIFTVSALNIADIPPQGNSFPDFPNTRFFRNPLPVCPACCMCEEVSEHRVRGAGQTSYSHAFALLKTQRYISGGHLSLSNRINFYVLRKYRRFQRGLRCFPVTPSRCEFFESTCNQTCRTDRQQDFLKPKTVRENGKELAAAVSQI